MKKIIFVILVGLLFSNCADYRAQRKVKKDSKFNSWMGAHKHDLIMSWGPPARTADDGNGGQILIYANHYYNQGMNFDWWDYTMFYANQTGILYHWMTRRENVPPTQLNIDLWLH